VQSGLVIGQVALTLVLMIGAGLVIKSFVRLQGVHLGIEPDHVLTFQSVQSRARYLKMTGTRINGFAEYDFSPVPAQVFSQIAERLLDIPGVESAAGINQRPLSGQTYDAPFTVAERASAPGDALTANYHLVTPRFFQTMRIPVLRGRDFTVRDTADSPWVAVINEAMAKRFWPNEDPIGQHITLGIVPDERPREIVAVVGDTPLYRSERTRTPMLYVPHTQQFLRYRVPYAGTRLQMAFVVRIRERPDTVAAAIRQVVAEVDPATPVAEVTMMEQYLAEQIETPRFYMVALGIFGAVATLLAVFGIYGVIAHAVAQRTREIAIRVALGANARTVAGLVLRHAVALTTVGILLGLGASLFATRLLDAVLWDVTPTDPSTFVAVVILFIAVAAVASLVPTSRTLRLEPRSVLAET
jgi:putative ABC transport system permease protein